MSALDELDWQKIREHYDERIEIHEELGELHRRRQISKFCRLSLGISSSLGNYSATEHRLGPQILSGNLSAEDRVFRLADSFIRLTNARSVPQLIRAAGLRYLQIGIGSEVSCTVNPKTCWIANTRTIWTHLVIKHNDDFDKANEELRLYRDADTSSEMAYQIWAHIHAEMATSLTRVAEAGAKISTSIGVGPGAIKFLWADAIASRMYDEYHK